jgi:hypothetical protein
MRGDLVGARRDRAHSSLPVSGPLPGCPSLSVNVD